MTWFNSTVGDQPLVAQRQSQHHDTVKVGGSIPPEWTMCVVSMVMDHYGAKWDQQWPQGWPQITPAVSREEFEELKRDIQELKALMKRAKAYDEANGEPDCEMREKVELVRRIAELVGVDLDDVLV